MELTAARPPAGAGGSRAASPVRGWRRAVRTALLGGSSLLLAGSAHSLGGGLVPSLPVLTVTGLLIGLISTTATARRCRLPLLTALLGCEQVLLHHWFTAVSHAEGPAPWCPPRA